MGETCLQHFHGQVNSFQEITTALARKHQKQTVKTQRVYAHLFLMCLVAFETALIADLYSYVSWSLLGSLGTLKARGTSQSVTVKNL